MHWKIHSVLAMIAVFGIALINCAGDGLDEYEDVETQATPLSTHEQCNTIPAAATFEAHFPETGHTSPWVYGSSSCAKGYAVDLTDQWSVTNWVRWGWSAPSSQSACEKIRVGAYAWRKNGSSTTFVGSKWRWGSWSGSTCSIPEVSSWEIGISEQGADYRIAAAARVYERRKDSSSYNVTAPVQFIAGPIYTTPGPQ